AAAGERDDLLQPDRLQAHAAAVVLGLKDAARDGEEERPDADALALGDARLLGDALAADAAAVDAGQVGEVEPVRLALEPGVVARDAGVSELDVAVGGAADDEPGLVLEQGADVEALLVRPAGELGGGEQDGGIAGRPGGEGLAALLAEAVRVVVGGLA